MDVYEKPHAHQIIDFDEENKFILDNEFLHRILLHKDIRDKPVCVISVTGAFRLGKSFLLNFLLRYLQYKYQLKDVTNWLDFENGPIKGFPWKNGDTRDTTGILMWSEVFLAELPSGEEIAIILLDTQGSFDLQSSVDDCVAIFVLSTLISSVQIYNLSKNVYQSDLSHLECFSSYGQFFANEDKPFQNLVFLIRDWQYPYKRPFGADGGRELLEQLFNNQENQCKGVTSQAKNIEKLFESIACFLMPHPGDKVAVTDDFKGDFEDMAPLFLKHIEEFVSTVLAPENLIPKSINGERIKVENLLNYIETYCQYFRDGGLPSVQSMFMATADAHHTTVFNEAKSLYEQSMSFVNSDELESLRDDVLLEEHKKNKKNALTYFEDKRILGDEEVKKRYKLNLEEVIEEKLLEYINLNDIKYKSEQKLKHEQNLRYEMDHKHQEELARQEDIRRHLQQTYENELKKEELVRHNLERSYEEHIQKQQQRHEKELEEEQNLKRELERRNEERIKEQRSIYEDEIAKVTKLSEEQKQISEARRREQEEKFEQELENERKRRLEEKLRNEERRNEERRKHQEEIKRERRLRREQELREEERRRLLQRRLDETSGLHLFNALTDRVLDHLPIRGLVKGVAETAHVLPLAVAVDTVQTAFAVEKDIKRGTTRNTVEKVATVAGGWSGGYAGVVAGATIGSMIPVAGTLVGGFVGGLVGSIGGSLTASFATTSIANTAGYDIQSRKCQICAQVFSVRLYKGEDYRLCSTCRSRDQQKSLQNSTQNLMRNLLQNPPQNRLQNPTTSIANIAGSNIQNRTCQICAQVFSVNLYKGEDYHLCSTCRSRDQQKSLQNSTQNLMPNPLQNPPQNPLQNRLQNPLLVPTAGPNSEPDMPISL